MNRRTIMAIAMLAAAVLLMPASAHRMYRESPTRFHRHPHHRRITVEGAEAGLRACDLGWWQTLRFGHVHPQWGISCQP